jgi:predicted ATPase
MLTHLQLGNFKSWRDTGRIGLAPITAFFGANSSGKTSLLQSLLLMRQTTESPDRSRVLELGGPTALVDLGTFNDLLFGHDSESTLALDLGWREEQAVSVVDLLARAKKKSSTRISSHEMSLRTEILVRNKWPEVQRVTYGLGDSTFAIAHREADDGYDLQSDSDYQFVRTQGRAWPLPPPSRFYGFPDQVRLYFQNATFLTDLELRFEERLGRVRYLGPLRDDPRRQYIYSGGRPSDVGRRGELAIDALIASRLSGVRNSRGWQGTSRPRRRPAIHLERLVAEWLSELGLIDSFELQSVDPEETLYRVWVRRTESSTPVLITDVGFGVSQVLPVLVLLAYAREGDTVVLEQPEIHLHPAVQAGLADIIIETALARRVQVIFESHSEHLLMRLQRRIAERRLDRGLTLNPENVSLYFCSQENGESKVAQLEVDLFGAITNWPRDFFGNQLAESVARVEAASRRQDATA